MLFVFRKYPRAQIAPIQKSMRLNIFTPYFYLYLFHGNGLRQVPGLIRIEALQQADLIGEEL